MRRKFSTQVDRKLLDQTREIAETEGRQLQAVIEEALADFIQKKRLTKARSYVIAHYQASLAQFGPLYERLAE